MFRRDVILIGTALLFGLVSMGHVRHLHAQSTPASPVFRTGVEAIQLDDDHGSGWPSHHRLDDRKATANDFSAHVNLLNEAGVVVLTKPLERVPGENGLLEGHRMGVALPLAEVAPGSYALQVHGRSGDNRDQRASRSLIVRVK